MMLEIDSNRMREDRGKETECRIGFVNQPLKLQNFLRVFVNHRDTNGHWQSTIGDLETMRHGG